MWWAGFKAVKRRLWVWFFFFPSVTSRFTQFLWIAPESTEGCLSDLSKKYNPCLQKHIHQCVSALTRRHSVSCPCSEAMFVRPRLCPLAANSSKLAPIFYSVYSSLLFLCFCFDLRFQVTPLCFLTIQKKYPLFFSSFCSTAVDPFTDDPMLRGKCQRFQTFSLPFFKN